MTNHGNSRHAEAGAEAFYRDRAGNPIDLDRWAELWGDFKYRCVVETQVEGTDALVRTVWQGIISPVSPMFATGVSTDGGKTWRTPAYGEDARTEEEALEQRKRAIRGVKDALRA